MGYKFPRFIRKTEEGKRSSQKKYETKKGTHFLNCLPESDYTILAVPVLAFMVRM